MIEWVTNHGLLVCWGVMFVIDGICQLTIPKHDRLTMWVLLILLLFMMITNNF
jgi:hypothetical protein